MGRKVTFEEFEERANKVHNGKYSYVKDSYKRTDIKTKIICPIHGEFLQTPHGHLKGNGCPKCYEATRLITTEIFKERADKVHKGKYIYTKTIYEEANKKVCIICPIHGEFWMTPSKHINAKQGCPYCQGMYKTTEQIVNEFKEVHGDKYDYSKVKYKNNKSKVCIVCPIHGEFWQTTSNHLKGRGCPKCAKENLRKLYVSNLGEFEIKARKIHGDNYIYTEGEYVNAHTPIKIICKEHGEFWQTPHKHINGRHGCPMCKESHLERYIRNLLFENNIEFVSQKNFDWLLFQKNLYLDFYLPDYNIAIECQGEQHYRAVNYFGGEEQFKISQERDKSKKQLCEEHGIKVLYFSDKKYADGIIIDKDILLEEILKNENNRRI